MAMFLLDVDGLAVAVAVAALGRLWVGNYA